MLESLPSPPIHGRARSRSGPGAIGRPDGLGAPVIVDQRRDEGEPNRSGLRPRRRAIFGTPDVLIVFPRSNAPETSVNSRALR